MLWVGLAILIIVCVFLYWKMRGSVTLSKEQAQLVGKLVKKEREELGKQMHDLVDEKALQGATLSLDSFCKVSEDMSEGEKEEVARLRSSLFEKYGSNIPVNTVHRISMELEGNVRIWSDNPGCFERHLQRRDGNLLFPQDRRVVTKKEIDEAKERDRVDQQRFREKAKTFAAGITVARETKVSPTKAYSILKELQELLKEAASIGGDIQDLIGTLEGTEDTLIELLNDVMPEGTDNLRMAQSYSVLERSPYMAQTSRNDSPILEQDQIPTLLSEDLETISLHGHLSREFAPDFRPNEADIRNHLEKAVNDGFSKDRAAQIIEAWNKSDIKNTDSQ